MHRVIFFIDGFNVYHSIKDNNSLRKYKWLNYSKLAKQFVTKDTINDIYLFTALAFWNPGKVIKHKIFIEAQEHYGVKIVYGKFYPVTKRCTNCKTIYNTHEEKQTDVNIATFILKLADEYDKAVIVSGDSDLIPAIVAVKEKCPTKIIQVVVPIGRKAKELINICDSHVKIKEHHLETSRLDNIVDMGNDRFLQCPYDWQ